MCFGEAAGFYNRERAGLGVAFVNEVERAVARASSMVRTSASTRRGAR